MTEPPDGVLGPEQVWTASALPLAYPGSDGETHIRFWTTKVKVGPYFCLRIRTTPPEDDQE